MRIVHDLRDSGETDAEIREMNHARALATNDHRRGLAETIQIMRQAATEVTEDQLERWHQLTGKRWTAQLELVMKHGLPANGRTGSPRVVFQQVRRSWLGNCVGLIIPLLALGFSSFERGLALPLFWFVSVGADVAGRSTCMSAAPIPRSALLDETQRDCPSTLTSGLRQKLLRARNGGSWKPSVEYIKQLRSIHEDLLDSEHTMRQRAKRGAVMTWIAIATVTIGQIALVFANLGPHGERLVGGGLLVLSTIVGVFGAATWITASSYHNAIDRPPFPRSASLKAVRRSMRVERALSGVNDEAFDSVQDIRDHSSNSMLKVREFAIALQRLDRLERQLKRQSA